MKTNKGGALMKLLVVALTLATVLIINPRLVSGASVSPSQCRAERQNGVNNCKSVLFGQAPSAACCRVVKLGHFECACPVVDAKLAALLTVKRASQVLRSCGRAVPHNFQCGSVYFP